MVPTNKITVISGKLFYVVFLSGASKILENQGLLNRINIFPVPDADTGTNLAYTIRDIIDRAQPHESFEETSKAIAIAALRGSRGTAGIIFAHFLYSMSIEASRYKEIDIDSFAEIVKNSSDYLSEALSEPMEGTMVSVIREWAQFIYSHRSAFDDFYSLFIQAFKAANDSLNQANQNPENLKNSLLTDAGAKSFVLFLEGVIEGIKKNRSHMEIVVNPGKIENGDNFPVTTNQLQYRYCVEALFDSQNIDHGQLKRSISTFGNSLIIAGSGSLTKIHIHTNNPHSLTQELRKFGNISQQRVDDMLRQNEAASNRLYNIALVTDSASDLPQDIIDRYQIYVLPLRIVLGKHQYLDKLTLKTENWRMLNKRWLNSSATSPPDITEIENLYSFLANHYDSVISLHLSGNLSRTFEFSKRAAEKISSLTGKKITVLDSRHISGSLGLLTLKIALEIDHGLGHNEIVENFPLWRQNTRIYMSVTNLKHLIRRGYINNNKAFSAQSLRLKNILSLNAEGYSTLQDRGISQKSNMNKLLKHTRKFLENKEIWNYMILHAEDESTAKLYSAKISELTGKKPLSVMSISPLLGISAGKGAVAIAILAN